MSRPTGRRSKAIITSRTISRASVPGWIQTPSLLVLTLKLKLRRPTRILHPHKVIQDPVFLSCSLSRAGA